MEQSTNSNQETTGSLNFRAWADQAATFAREKPFKALALGALAGVALPFVLRRQIIRKVLWAAVSKKATRVLQERKFV